MGQASIIKVVGGHPEEAVRFALEHVFFFAAGPVILIPLHYEQYFEAEPCEHWKPDADLHVSGPFFAFQGDRADRVFVAIVQIWSWISPKSFGNAIPQSRMS